MIRRTSYTVDEAKKKLENYCVYQERCHKEVERKLAEMNMIELAKDDIILHLMNQNFLNEERFAKSFARGKFNIKNWGKQRIIRELKFRNISEFNIKTALKEFTTEEYLHSFNRLANKKIQNITIINNHVQISRQTRL